MLSQQEADSLIAELKEIIRLSGQITFPQPGGKQRLELASTDGTHSFIVDISRKGYMNFVKKCTYQGRFQKDVVLLRLDVDGPEHTNPDGEILPRTHLHIYREGYGDRFAIPVPPDMTDTSDLFQTLIDFLTYFKTVNANALEIETVI